MATAISSSSMTSPSFISNLKPRAVTARPASSWGQEGKREITREGKWWMRSSLGPENGGPTVHIAGELASAPPHLPPLPAPSLHTRTPSLERTGRGSGGEKADERAQGTQTQAGVPRVAVALRLNKRPSWDTLESQTGDWKGSPFPGLWGFRSLGERSPHRGPQNASQVFSFPAPSLPGKTESWFFSPVYYTGCTDFFFFF